jgi:hypothetical protein
MRSIGLERSTSWEQAVVISMDDYRKAKAAKRIEPARRYDEVLLCVNWNSTVGLIPMSCCQTEQGLSPQLPEDFANFDVRGFLDRVYALASQI